MSVYSKVLLILLTVLTVAAVSVAAETSKKEKLLCAMTEVVECDALGDCIEVLPETVGLPDFVIVDLEQKQLLEANDEGGRSTKIDAVAEGEGILSFGGLDHGRGWSAVLSSENSLLSATITDDQVGFVVFGACIQKP